MSGRQAWLRDPNRERSSSLVDPRPLEAAVLEPRADTMRDMVRQYVNQRTLDDRQEDEPFLDDEEFAIETAEEPFSEYQLAEMEAEAHRQITLMHNQERSESTAEGGGQPLPPEAEAPEDPTVPA